MINQADVIASFRIRRRAALLLAIPTVTGIVAAIFNDPVSGWIGIEQGIIVRAGFIAAALGFTATALVYRCPSCGAVPTDFGVFTGNAIDLSATKCSKCGVTLRCSA